MGNSKLLTAAANRRDEFYTQIEDIDNEVKNYIHHFKDKIVYCNCDDPLTSNFVKYFYDNFERFQLKQLLASCYVPREQNLFSLNKPVGKATWMEYNGEGTIKDNVKYLEGDGDFRGLEATSLLKRADIVITNPPFSLFKDYILNLIEMDKKFLIMGTINAMTYKEIFQHMKTDEVRLGHYVNQRIEFKVDKEYPFVGRSNRIDEEGNKFITVPTITWYTNMPNGKENEFLELTEEYSEDKYVEYDNYKAINVDKTSDIPINFEGVMGVPVTFMNKYNPKQFKILGLDSNVADELSYLKKKDWNGGITRGVVKGQVKYARILIKHRRDIDVES